MTQEGLEEIFAQYAQTIEAFRPVKSIATYQYEDDLFDDDDDGQGDDLWVAEDEQEATLPIPPTQSEPEKDQSKTNSVDSTSSSIFSQPNATISNESLEGQVRAPSPLSDKPLPANPMANNDDTAKQARRKSGFGGNKNRLSWTSDTGITSSVVSQNLANEIMSLFDMDFAIDIKVDTAPKLPELPFKPRRRSQQRQSQDMLTSLIPAFEKIALENSDRFQFAQSPPLVQPPRLKPNLVIKSVPQRSSSLRHRQEIQLDTKQSPISPPPDSPVEKSLSKKKSIMRLASLMTGKKSKDLPASPEASPITSTPEKNTSSATVNTPRKTSTSTVDSSMSSSSSWSYVSENGDLRILAPQKPLPQTPISSDTMPANTQDGGYFSSTNEKQHKARRSTKKKRRSIMEKTMSKRKSSHGLSETSLNDLSTESPTPTLSRSKSAFIKIGNGLKTKKQLKQIRRTSSAKNLTETLPQHYFDSNATKQQRLDTNFHYHTSAEVNHLYVQESSDETIASLVGESPSHHQSSFVKRMASFNWRMKSRNKPVEV
jgi:hypothetical protein